MCLVRAAKKVGQAHFSTLTLIGTKSS
jgi:hypothetical protein